jgi:hypothetical protein
VRRDEELRWNHQDQSARRGAESSRDGDERTEALPALPATVESPFSGWTIEALPPPRPRTNRRRILLGIGAVLLVVIVLGAVLANAHAGGSIGLGGANATGMRLTPTADTSGAQTVRLPSGIPLYFSFGAMNAPGDVALLDDMRTRNGTAWDYRYQYLDGGVNTAHGWETWNSPTGAFASLYMQESGSHHYIPAFVYYEMLQSNGACGGCTEPDTDLANLDNPSVMGSYLANWRLLMKEIGSFGRPVLVIVEPDLWGYMQRAVFSKGDVPSAVPASVASSGDPDANGLPNNAQGYAWALLHIRDLYAPNAVLALHMSSWSTGNDVGSNTDPHLDDGGTAQQTALFLSGAGLIGNPANISTWDLLSSDIADRDSGQGAPWWDPTNVDYPNFSRYLSFVSDMTKATGKKVVLWQVPEGNQYFDTENNTPHHTQDNRAAYILGHVADFARAGIVGVLFGPGNGGTSIDDEAHDGVTNPAPIPSFECNACNTHISTYADDDGGYLRIFVGAYYRHGPLMLADPDAWTPPSSPDASATVTPGPQGECVGSPIVSIGGTSASPDPAHPGQQETYSTYLTTNCDTTVLVYIEVSIPGDRVTQVVQDNVRCSAGQAQQVQITGLFPASAKPGTYSVKVGVFRAGWGAQYAWDNNAATLVVD